MLCDVRRMMRSFVKLENAKCLVYRYLAVQVMTFSLMRDCIRGHLVIAGNVMPQLPGKELSPHRPRGIVYRPSGHLIFRHLELCSEQLRFVHCKAQLFVSC